MVFLRRIKRFRRRDLGRDRFLKLAGLAEAPDYAFGGFLLGFAGREDGRSILSADVIVLPVQRGGIVHAEKIIQESLVAEPGGIEYGLNGLGVARAAGANLFVSWIRSGAAAVTDRGFDHAGNFTNDFLHAPKTTAGQNGGLVHGS